MDKQARGSELGGSSTGQYGAVRNNSGSYMEEDTQQKKKKRTVGGKKYAEDNVWTLILWQRS